MYSKFEVVVMFIRVSLLITGVKLFAYSVIAGFNLPFFIIGSVCLGMYANSDIFIRHIRDA